MTTFQESLLHSCLFYESKGPTYNVFQQKWSNDIFMEFNAFNQEEKSKFLQPYDLRGTEYLEDFQKLAFFVSKFHILTKSHTNMLFNKNYIASTIFYNDLARIVANGRHIITNKYYIQNLFELSIILLMPVFKRKAPDDPTPQSFNYTSSRALFEDNSDNGEPTYNEVSPDIEFNSTLEDLLGTISLSIGKLKSALVSVTIPLADVLKFRNEAEVSYLHYYNLKQIAPLFGWEITPQSTLGKVRPDMVFECKGVKVPLELKLAGVLHSITNARSNSQLKHFTHTPLFLDIFNQLTYQILFGNTDVGMILDSNSFSILRISEIGNMGGILTNTGQEIFPIKATMSVFELEECGQTPALLLAAILYNKGLTSDHPAKSSHILDSLQRKEAQVTSSLLIQKEFCKNLWLNRRVTFVPNSLGTEFRHPSYPQISIPSHNHRIFLSDTKYSVMHYNEFNIKETLSGEIDHTKYSKVMKVQLKSNPSKDLVLKVYDARKTINSRKCRPQLEFQYNMSTMIIMFTKEIEAYLAMRKGFSTTAVIPPTSASSEVNNQKAAEGTIEEDPDIVHNIPNIIAAGFLTSDDYNDPVGFFLLENYIENGILQSMKENIIEKGLKALKKIHDLGIVHEDIHELNFLYCLSNERFYFIDFGLSSYRRYRLGIKQEGNKSFEQKKEADRQALIGAIERLFAKNATIINP